MANEKQLIDVNALIAEYDRVHIGEPGKARKLMEDAPTIDAVEVVRCLECKKHSDADGKHYCKFWRMYCPDDSDFFCKAGERKDGEMEVDNGSNSN